MPSFNLINRTLRRKGASNARSNNKTKARARRNKKKTNKRHARKGQITVVTAPLVRSTVHRGSSRPRQVSTREGIRVSHRELFYTISQSEPGAGVLLEKVEAGNQSMFPWLSTLAKLYDCAKFDHITFTFMPTAPATTPGYVIMAWDPDSNTPDNSIDYAKVMSWKYHTRTPVWQQASLTIPASQFIKRLIGNGASTDPAMSLIKGNGAFFAFTSDSAGTTVFGDIFVSYSVTLSVPQVPSIATDAIVAKTFNVNAGNMLTMGTWLVPPSLPVVQGRDNLVLCAPGSDPDLVLNRSEWQPAEDVSFFEFMSTIKSVVTGFATLVGLTKLAVDFITRPSTNSDNSIYNTDNATHRPLDTHVVRMTCSNPTKATLAVDISLQNTHFSSKVDGASYVAAPQHYGPNVVPVMTLPFVNRDTPVTFLAPQQATEKLRVFLPPGESVTYLNSVPNLMTTSRAFRPVMSVKQFGGGNSTLIFTMQQTDATAAIRDAIRSKTAHPALASAYMRSGDLSRSVRKCLPTEEEDVVDMAEYKSMFHSPDPVTLSEGEESDEESDDFELPSSLSSKTMSIVAAVKRVMNNSSSSTLR